MSRIVGLVFPEETKEEATGVPVSVDTPSVTNPETPETPETATSAETSKSEEPEKDKKKGK